MRLYAKTTAVPSPPRQRPHFQPAPQRPMQRLPFHALSAMCQLPRTLIPSFPALAISAILVAMRSGPNFVNTDLSLVKNTKLTERMSLQFRTEAFDIFNHPNFGNPNLNVQSSSFGRITGTRFPVGDFGSARQLQLSLKLQF